MSLLDLAGQRGLVVGTANASSIAYGCAKAFHAAGVGIEITYQHPAQSAICTGGPDERRIDDRQTHALAHTPVKPTFPGLKKLLLPLRPNRGSGDIAAIGTARALFQAPESARSTQHEGLVEFTSVDRWLPASNEAGYREGWRSGCCC